VVLALQWASLDMLSEGRTILAVCAGGPASKGPQFAAELAAVGVASNERVDRMEEGIALLRRFWADEPVHFEGRFYRFENVDLRPKPRQQHLPIIIAVNPQPSADPQVVERALRRVARLADGWQTDGVAPGLFRERWARIRAYADEYGRAEQVNDASLHLMVNINDNAEQALRESVAFLDRYYGAGMVSREKLDAWLAYGSPAAVIDKIGQFIEAGCTTPVLRFTASNQQEQLERCIADVLPAFG
jgi:alkanesulfonate monooxygenase SsuD/methylene tetrahydromethanopterin reductase-like flavin-dependent oxidoreductase (luciferase family)